MSWASDAAMMKHPYLGSKETHSTDLLTHEAMGQGGHTCIASAETSRNSFSVAPLAA
jgi:hypothetical protein